VQNSKCNLEEHQYYFPVFQANITSPFNMHIICSILFINAQQQ